MCAVGTGLAEADPAETQGEFLAPITSPPARALSGLGSQDWGDLRGSLGLGKVWRAGGLGPALGSTLPYPRGAGVPALGALLPSEEEGEGCGTSTSQVWRPQASCPPAIGVLIRMGGEESLDSYGLCLRTDFATPRHLLHFARGRPFPSSLPGARRMQVSNTLRPAPCPPPSSAQGLSLFSAPTLLPFLCPGCVGAGGQDWGGAEGCSARGCEGPGATSRGSGVQGGVGESTRKLPRSRCRGASEPSGLRGLAPLGPAGQAGGLWCLSPALQTDGRAPGCRPA